MGIELQWDIPAPEDLAGLEALLDRVAAACFEAEGVEGVGFAVRVTDDDAIRRLNRETRGIDRATDVLSFVANALMCSLIEFSMGLLVNADHQLWDYSDHFGNIMGQVCLQNTIAFGVAASIIAWFVYPALERWLARFPRDRMNIAFVAVALFGAIVWSLYLVTPPGELDVNGAETEEGQALSERDEIELGLGFTDATSEALYETIENAESLTDEEKAELLEHLQTIDAELNAVAEELGFDLETDEAA